MGPKPAMGTTQHNALLTPWQSGLMTFRRQLTIITGTLSAITVARLVLAKARVGLGAAGVFGDALAIAQFETCGGDSGRGADG